MLRFTTTIFLLLSFTAQTFGQAFIVFDYYLNKAGYAKQCENKARPQLRCSGKCQMAKKLKAEEENEKQNGERKAERKAETALSSQSSFPALNVEAAALKTYFLPTDCGTVIMRPHTHFHPPCRRSYSMA